MQAPVLGTLDFIREAGGDWAAGAIHGRDGSSSIAFVFKGDGGQEKEVLRGPVPVGKTARRLVIFYFGTRMGEARGAIRGILAPFSIQGERLNGGLITIIRPVSNK